MNILLKNKNKIEIVVEFSVNSWLAKQMNASNLSNKLIKK
jgi:hypothetical protein